MSDHTTTFKRLSCCQHDANAHQLDPTVSSTADSDRRDFSAHLDLRSVSAFTGQSIHNVQREKSKQSKQLPVEIVEEQKRHQMLFRKRLWVGQLSNWLKHLMKEQLEN